MLGQIQGNNSNTRGGVIGFVGRVLTRVKDFFVASWAYFKSSNATFGSMGDELITSAQTDLMNLRGRLDKLWIIQDQDKETTALYVSAVLGKFGFTFIIIGVSLIASFLKLTGGACCLFLAGRWFTLVSKILSIFRDIFVQTLTMLKNGLRGFVTNALDLCSTIAQKLGYYAGKFLRAILSVLRALTPYLSRAWQMILDFVAAASRGFVSALKWIGNGLLNAWQITLDFFAAAYRAIWQGIKAIGRLAKCVFKNFGSAIINCIKGVGHIFLGILRAGSIVATGIVLGVAALFIETGLANSFSGVAKTMFILDESLAAAVGALMDGVYASGSSFINAAKSMFGYGVTIPQATPVQAAADVYVPVAQVAADADGLGTELNDAAVTTPMLDDSMYFSRKARDNVHYVNERIASIGNKLLHSYQEQRNRMIGASGWSDSGVSEIEGLASRHVPTYS